MGRQAAMQKINAALNPVAAPPPSASGGSSAPPSAPHAAPGVTSPTPLTADEKRGFDAARIQRLDDEKRARQQLDDQAKLAQQQAAAFQQDLAQQQAEEDAFAKAANDATNAATQILHGASVKLERLPTPGSLVLPLVILLVFFFLLIPVNGHTRLQWLWLVMTGNAEISGSGQGGFASGDFCTGNSSNSSSSGDQGGFASGDFGNSSNSSSNRGTASNIIPLPNFSIGSLMTGVEDLQV